MTEIALSAIVQTWLRFRQPTDAPTVKRQTPAVRLVVKLSVLPFASTGAQPNPNLPHSHVLDALLDTGAPLTLFPHTAWQPFAADVRWLVPTAGSVWNLRVGGCAYDYRMGEVRVCAFDTPGPFCPRSHAAPRS